MKKNKKLLLTILCLFLLLNNVKSIAQNQVERKPNKDGYFVKIGDHVDNIDFTFDDGTKTSLNELHNKIIILQFTASWCSVCQKEMPYLESDLWQKYKDKGLLIIGIDFKESLETIKKFKKQTGVTYPLALDPEATIFQTFAHIKSGVTRNIVLDENKNIIYLTRLFRDEEFKKMVEIVDKYLK